MKTAKNVKVFFQNRIDIEGNPNMLTVCVGDKQVNMLLSNPTSLTEFGNAIKAIGNAIIKEDK